ncbi:MAG TPA: hypothetical protein VFX02_00715 [Gammaproteobacteria bacterium]|nr:hypothetical protein [Gammaproteobacteria bacterium]
MAIDKPFVIVKYTLIEAVSRRFVLLFAAAILLSIVISLYAASLSMLEKQQTLAAFYGFSMRLFSAGLFAAWVITAEARSLDQANAPLFLALPVSRVQYLLARLCGYALIAVIAQLAITLPLLVLPISSGTVLAWALSSVCELLIVIMLAMTLVLIFSQSVVCLFLFTVIYLFARSSGEFWRHSNTILNGGGGLEQKIIAWPLKLITYLVPRLEEYAGAYWLLRDTVPPMSLRNVTLETAVYVLLLLAIAVERIRKRAF